MGRLVTRKIVKDGKNFSEWYTHTLLNAKLLDYSEVSGCHILRPLGQSFWSRIQSHLQSLLPSSVANVSFPLLIPESSLALETSHLTGFSPEVAWVSEVGSRGTDGGTGEQLANRLAIRPTSETAMYPAFSRWIQSYRDLPLRLNQWCNVVRWEFDHPIPLIRSREFHWQEGHSAFASEEEAKSEVMEIAEIYRRVYEDFLAVPVVVGRKSLKETFAGALESISTETFIPEVGRGIQGATAHNLGQNFSKMFNICFEDEFNLRRNAWQTSWGFSTRSMGITVMTHGNETGLILPPLAAPTQIVIIPIPPNNVEVMQKCQQILSQLTESGLRAIIDGDERSSVGMKFYKHEIEGVPLRIDVGLKELSENSIKTKVRDEAESKSGSLEGLVDQIKDELGLMHQRLLMNARSKIKPVIVLDIKQVLDMGDIKAPILAPWCLRGECEESLKKISSSSSKSQTRPIKSLCIPLANQHGTDEASKHRCFNCTEMALEWTLFGRTY